MAKLSLCPCGGTHKFENCCGRYINGGANAPTAEALMRSRYVAHALGCEAYLLETWHASTRPAGLVLLNEGRTRWIGLEVRRHEQQDAEHAVVEFVARYKVNGRAHRLHEVSRFVREAGQWLYAGRDVG